MSLPLVSIVTPSFNQGAFIADTLESVKRQRYPRIEHLVVDGGSTDGTIDVLKRYEGQYDLAWASEADRGQADAVNKGFDRARGEIVGWLNSDDVYVSPTAVASVVDAFQRAPDADIVYGDYVFLDRSGEIFRVAPVLRRLTPWRTYFHCIGQPSVFFRASVVSRYRPRADLHYAFDHEYWMRLVKHCRFVYLNEIVAGSRAYSETKSFGGSRKVWQALEQMRREHYPPTLAGLWPIERVISHLVTAWLRLRGLAWLFDLRRRELAFAGRVPSTLRLLALQLFVPTRRYVGRRNA